MSKFEEKVALYTKSLVEKCDVNPNEELLRAVTKSLGPSIYNADAEIIAASDKEEVLRLKTYLKKKLELTDEAVDESVEYAFATLGSSNPRKYRAVVCYLVVVKLGKESLYS